MHQMIIEFLKAYFNLFKAQVLEFTSVDNKIIGTVGWFNEEDKQDFIATFSDDFLLPNATLLCKFLNDNNLIMGDLVTISERELISKLIISGWSNGDATNAIDFLFSFEVKMVDDGIESDSFFLHF